MLNTRIFAGRVFVFLLIVSAFFLFGYALNFVLLVFASILFAVLLSSGANAIATRFNINYKIGVGIVLLIIAILITAVILLLGPSLSDQIDEMIEVLPKSIASLEEQLKESKLGRRLLDEIPDDPAKVIDNQMAVKKIGGAFSALLGVIANIAIVLVVGIFLAINPAMYRRGFVRLFPVDKRNRIDEVLIKCYDNMGSWLLAQLMSMSIVGIATGVGLMLLGMPLSWALALIAFSFAFIPNIGPYIALAPAVLIALMEGPNMALYVVILYFGIQIVESYFITPLIQKKMVDIPPALLLLWQVMFGLFAGITGLFLATPILAATMVLVKELYVRDKLESNVSE